jgi:hypothetical protein
MIPEDVVAAAGPNDPERWLPVRSVAGQTRTSKDVRVTSAHPSITDIKPTLRDVRHGPIPTK